jgi:hypothetical protein
MNIVEMENSISDLKTELRRLKDIENAKKKRILNLEKTVKKLDLLSGELEELVWIYKRFGFDYRLRQCKTLEERVNFITGDYTNENVEQGNFLFFFNSIGANITVHKSIGGYYNLSIEDITFFLNYIAKPDIEYKNSQIQEIFEEKYPEFKNKECNVCSNTKCGFDFIRFADNNDKRICNCKYDVCFDCGEKIDKCVFCRKSCYKKILVVDDILINEN